LPQLVGQIPTTGRETVLNSDTPIWVTEKGGNWKIFSGNLEEARSGG
jgi:hypothetical protein